MANEFTAELLMQAMEEHQVQEVAEGYKWTKEEWLAYVQKIADFAHAKGCKEMKDEAHLPKRLGQIRKAYEEAGVPCPRYPKRPAKKADPNYETMVDIIKRRQAAKDSQ